MISESPSSTQFPQPPNSREYIFTKYQSVLKQKNLPIPTFKYLILPQLHTPTNRNTHTHRNKAEESQTVSRYSIRGNSVGKCAGDEDEVREGTFLEQIDWEAFQRTNQHPGVALERPRLSIGFNWLQKESKSVLKRYQNKVKQQTDRIDFNITKKYREIKDKQSRALKALTEQQLAQREKHPQPKKFTIISNPPESQIPQQQQSCIPPQFLRLLNQPSNKKSLKQTKFLSTICQKRVKKIFDMDVAGKDAYDNTSTVAGSLPSIP